MQTKIMETCYNFFLILTEHPNYACYPSRNNQEIDIVSSPTISVSDHAMALADLSRRRI